MDVVLNSVFLPMILVQMDDVCGKMDPFLLDANVKHPAIVFPKLVKVRNASNNAQLSNVKTDLHAPMVFVNVPTVLPVTIVKLNQTNALALFATTAVFALLANALVMVDSLVIDAKICLFLKIPLEQKKLEGITEILMKKMEQQSAVLVQRLEAMQKQMSGVQGALVTQMAAKAREDITTKLEDSKTLFANTFQRIKAKGTMIKQSLDAAKRLLQDDNDGSKREQQLMDAIRRKSKAAAAVASVAQEAKVEKKMEEQVKKTILVSKQRTQKNSLEILPNRQPPAPPRPADAIKKAPEPIIPPLEQPSDPAPDRDLSQIYNGIPTVNVPVIGRNELLGGINVIGQHDETMTQLHGLTTDVEMKE